MIKQDEQIITIVLLNDFALLITSDFEIRIIFQNLK